MNRLRWDSKISCHECDVSQLAEDWRVKNDELHQSVGDPLLNLLPNLDRSIGGFLFRIGLVGSDGDCTRRQ